MKRSPSHKRAITSVVNTISKANVNIESTLVRAKNGILNKVRKRKEYMRRKKSDKQTTEPKKEITNNKTTTKQQNGTSSTTTTSTPISTTPSSKKEKTPKKHKNGKKKKKKKPKQPKSKTNGSILDKKKWPPEPKPIKKTTIVENVKSKVISKFPSINIKKKPKKNAVYSASSSDLKRVNNKPQGSVSPKAPPKLLNRHKKTLSHSFTNVIAKKLQQNHLPKFLNGRDRQNSLRKPLLSPLPLTPTGSYVNEDDIESIKLPTSNLFINTKKSLIDKDGYATDDSDSAEINCNFDVIDEHRDFDEGSITPQSNQLLTFTPSPQVSGNINDNKLKSVPKPKLIVSNTVPAKDSDEDNHTPSRPQSKQSGLTKKLKSKSKKKPSSARFARQRSTSNIDMSMRKAQQQFNKYSHQSSHHNLPDIDLVNRNHRHAFRKYSIHSANGLIDKSKEVKINDLKDIVESPKTKKKKEEDEDYDIEFDVPVDGYVEDNESDSDNDVEIIETSIFNFDDLVVESFNEDELGHLHEEKEEEYKADELELMHQASISVSKNKKKNNNHSRKPSNQWVVKSNEFEEDDKKNAKLKMGFNPSEGYARYDPTTKGLIWPNGAKWIPKDFELFRGKWRDPQGHVIEISDKGELQYVSPKDMGKYQCTITGYLKIQISFGSSVFQAKLLDMNQLKWDNSSIWKRINTQDN